MIIMLRINFKGTGTEKRRDRRILQRWGGANNIFGELDVEAEKKSGVKI